MVKSPAILRNEVGWFDEEENNSSLLAARLATDAADVKSAIAERISVILQNMTSLFTSFIVAFIVEWRVSLLILATFPLLVLANFAQVRPSFITLISQKDLLMNLLDQHVRFYGLPSLGRNKDKKKKSKYNNNKKRIVALKKKTIK